METSKYRERIARLSLMSDVCAKILLDNNTKAVGKIVSVILGEEILIDKVLKSVEFKFEPTSKGVIFDFIAKNQEYYINIEIQKRYNKQDVFEKIHHYYCAMGTSYRKVDSIAKKRIKNKRILIFLVKGNLFNNGKIVTKLSLYDQFNEEIGAYEDQILYVVNVSKEDDTPVGRLCHDMNCTNPNEMYYSELQETLAFMYTEEGEKIMCEVFEEVKEEGFEIGRIEGIEIGKNEGIEIGKSEGIEIGKNEGIEIGTMNTKKQFLEKLLKKGFRNLNELKDYTDLSSNVIIEIAQGKNIQLIV